MCKFEDFLLLFDFPLFSAEHRSTKHHYLCLACNQKFSKEYSIAKHVKNEHVQFKNLKIQACKYCDLVLYDRGERQFHEAKIHPDCFSKKNFFKCPHCMATFTLIDTCRIHVKQSHSTTLFTCRKCELVFQDSAGKVAHRLLAHNKHRKKQIDNLTTNNDTKEQIRDLNHGDSDVMIYNSGNNVTIGNF